MIAFRVRVRTATHSHSYLAIGRSAAAVQKAAEDRFDEPCGVAVIPISKERACL